MFHIESLLIQGIRSYSPRQQQIIDFDQPITIIHGKNGTGKTTVIESLNYVISNELPPATKMCSFVNDPKVTDSTDVRAQVKLKFVDCNNLKCVVTRSMTSSVKSSGKVESKSLEGTLLCYADENDQSQRSSVSSRSADLTSAMLSHLSRDISPALLNNVIFCHQENASWPLSEGKNLKEKFDAIFSASKYISVMDSVKKVKKDEIVCKIKESKVELVHLEERKKKANALMNSLNGYQINYDELSEQLSKIEISYNDTYGEFVDIEKIFEAVKSSFDELKSLESKIEHLEKIVGDNFNEDVDVVLLKAEQDELLFNMEFNRNEVALQKESMLILRSKHEEVCRELSEVSEEICRCSVEREICQKNFDKLKECLLVFNVDVGAECCCFKEDEMNSLKGKIFSLNEKLEKELDSINYEQFEVEGLVENVENERRDIYEQIKMIQNDHKNCVQNLDMLKDELKNVEGEIKKYSQNTQNVDILKKEFDGFNEKLMFVVEEIENASKKLEKLKNKRINLIKNLNNLEKYNEVKSEIQTIKSSIDEISSEIKSLAKSKIDITLESSLKEMEYQEKSISNELAELKTLQKKTIKQKKERDDFFNKTRHLHEYSSTEEAKISLTQILNETEREILKNQTLCRLLDQQNVVSKENDNCPVCERNFDNIDDKKKFFKKCKSSKGELKKLLDKKEKLTKVLSDISVEFGVVDETDYNFLIREKEEGLKAVQQNLISLKNQSNNVKKINALEEKKKFFEENLNQKSLKLNEFVIEKYSDIDEIKDKINKNENKIASISKEINLNKNEKTNLTTKANQLNNEIVKLTHHDKNLYLFSNKKTEIESKIEKTTFEIEKMTKIEKQKNSQKESIDLKLNQVLTKKITVSNKLKKFKQSFDQIEKINQLQKELSSSSKTSKKLSELNEKQEEIQTKKKSLSEKINFFKSTIAGLAEQTNDYNDKYIKNSQTFALIEHKQTLKKLINEHTNKKRALSQSKSVAEMNLLLNAKRSELDSYMQDKQYIKGQMAALLEQITDLKLQCETSFYGDADFDYMKKLAGLKICEGIQNDLDLYYKALDYAIMEFHSIKMKEINRIIRHYWKMTYCGSDIDTIEIRSEHTEKPEKITKSQLRKVYNYKVVILGRNRQVALEMKDKCSAGQKMLASIIIRLALARAFCADLGVLTLDEPTTNLDKDNVITLADALKKLVKSSSEDITNSTSVGGKRNRARGLQLIVITHDKDFVCRLGRSMLTHYYKVDKDMQGCSRVERMPIVDLLE